MLIIWPLLQALARNDIFYSNSKQTSGSNWQLFLLWDPTGQLNVNNNDVLYTVHLTVYTCTWDNRSYLGPANVQKSHEVIV